MSRAARLFLSCALALVPAACRLPGGGAPPPPARGVVLVLAAGFGGGGEAARTPVLARLASEGRAFDHAFAPDPDPLRARRAILDALDAARLAAGSVAVAAVGDADAVPLAPGRASLSLTAGLDPARLERWLREQQRFLVVAAVGGGPGASSGLPPPATLAGALAPSLPRIAVADLGFGAWPGGELRPAAWSEPARRRAEAQHLARSLLADRELGALLELVDRAAPGAATIVVSDPAPPRGAHGRLERPDALFDETLRAALVVRAQGLARPGRASGGLVSTLDAPPTVLALLGLVHDAAGDAAPTALSPLPHESFGGARSLMPLLARPDAEAREEVVSSVPRRAGRLGRSLRSSRFRYTEWPDGSRELYDHADDPAEAVNLAGSAEHALRLQELRQRLRQNEAARAEGGGNDPAPRGARAARPKNVVLIVVDDLRAPGPGWGAGVRTPSIDRLAARGVRFERAYAQVAMCSPSRVSMLVGWRPARTGVWQNEDPPRPRGSVPLQEHFAAHGAFTASIGKVYHSPADFAWDLREEHPEVVEERDPEAAGEGDASLWVKAHGSDLDQPDGRRARRVAALLASARRPFFLALGLVRPHVRWVAPERYFGFYPPDSIAPVPYPADDLADVPAIGVKTQPQPLPGLPLAGREPPGLVRDLSLRRQAIAAYQACVTFADAQVGVVLDALEREGRFEDTVVVLVGDNGFHLGEHGGLLRKDTLFEGALHVPLVIAAPTLKRRGAVVREPVELVDVYPTIVALAGLPPPPGLDGRSLVPVIEQPDASVRGEAVSYRRVQPPERGLSLRGARLRYTLWPDGSEELYERRGDAPETENLAARPEWAAHKARLRARLEALAAAPAPGSR